MLRGTGTDSKIGPKFQCCGAGGLIGVGTRLLKHLWLRLSAKFLFVNNNVADPDPHESGTFAWIQNYSSGSSKKWKSRWIKLWILDCLFFRPVAWNKEWQIVDKIFFLIEFKVFNIISKYTWLIWVGSIFAWNRNFCLDLDLGKLKAGSGSGKNHSRSATLVNCQLESNFG